MKKLLYLSFFLFFSTAGFSQNSLPRSTPEKEGVSAEGITRFYDAVAEKGMDMHSLMVVRHGKVIAEKWWGDNAPDKNHVLFSVSKSFTATAVGFAVHEKLFSLDDKVISFFPDQLPQNVSLYLKEMKVRDLLIMAAGQEKDPSGDIRKEDGDWVKAFLAVPLVEKPGTRFVYNSLATYMLSAIVQKTSGQKLINYLDSRLFQPLGIRDITWDTSPSGVNMGGWGLSVKTEDLAKFGQLFLQKGMWNGKQLLPKGWVEEASTYKIDSNPAGQPQMKDSSSDWTQGYCYQMWRCLHNAFRADGANGQFVVVMPEQDMVVAITANVGDMQTELRLIWDYILPATQ